MSEICRYLPAGERNALWQARQGPIPEGVRVGQICLVPYCGKYEHMILVDDLARRRKYPLREIGERLASLKMDEYFDLPDEACHSKAVVGFRCALQAVSAVRLVRFVVRALPLAAGIRVIRTGTWETLGQARQQTKTTHPILCLNPWKRPAIWMLGAESLHRRMVRKSVCGAKGCVMPPVAGAEFCLHHDKFFAYPISMTDSAVDYRSFWKPWNPHAGYELVNSERPRSIWNLEKSLTFVKQSVVDSRHKSTTEKPVKPTVTDYSRSSGRMGMRSSGGSHTSSKTTAGRRRAASRQGPGGRHTTKEKCWDRETIEALEKEADKILGLDTPEVTIRAEEMRMAQFQHFQSPTYPLCQSYEIMEEEFTEEEERDQLALHVGALPFEDYELSAAKP